MQIKKWHVIIYQYNLPRFLVTSIIFIEEWEAGVLLGQLIPADFSCFHQEKYVSAWHLADAETGAAAAGNCYVHHMVYVGKSTWNIENLSIFP